jgi:hypothetical protein
LRTGCADRLAWDDDAAVRLILNLDLVDRGVGVEEFDHLLARPLLRVQAGVHDEVDRAPHASNVRAYRKQVGKAPSKDFEARSFNDRVAVAVVFRLRAPLVLPLPSWPTTRSIASSISRAAAASWR